MNRDNYAFRLVTGAMRSGTTLLGELLHPRNGAPNHPDLVFSNDQTDFARELSRRTRAIKCPDSKLEDLTCDLSLRKKDMARLLEKRLWFFSSAKEMRSEIQASITKNILACASGHSSFSHIGCKTTHLINEISMLDSLFNDFKCIIVIRDPRDVVASNITRMRDRGLHTALMIISTMLSYEHFIKNNSHKIMTVKYEDIVLNTKPTIAMILDWLGLEEKRYNWNYLDHVGSNSSYGASKGLEIVPEIGINNRSISAFENILSKDLQYFTISLLSGYMDMFDYHYVALKRDEKADSYIRQEITKQLLKEMAQNGVNDSLLVNKLQEKNLI